MKSAWFWNTPMWEQYQIEYWKGRVRPEEYKTSPLADDHDFKDVTADIAFYGHDTQVLDLAPPIEYLWRGVRASYHSIIHRAEEEYQIGEWRTIKNFQLLHGQANGQQPRPDKTYEYQEQWIKDGYGLLIMATRYVRVGLLEPILYCAAASYWILYQGCAYYCSGPSMEKNVQHAVIWHSLQLLKARGVRLVELGQVDGETEKERNIGRFKQGFGGQAVPFTIARRTA